MKNRKGRRSRNKGLSMQKATCNEAATSNGDRFSTLPDDILLNVLERVETLDALRTCILSKRMLKLPTMLSHIVVDIGSLVYHRRSRGLSFRDLVRINGAVADVTENILSTRSPEIPIRKLKVRFVLRHYDFLSVVRSFARAMATQKVEKAEIEIMTEKVSYDYCTPADLLDSAKQFNTILDACPDAFAGLTRLWLQNMTFGELDIPNILSTCKRLQSFRLTYCDSGTRSVLQIEHDQLIELEIDYGEFETVKLTYLPKLQQVSYKNWCYEDQPLSFGFVPQLSKLSLTKTGVRSDRALELSQVLANFPSISELHLDFESEKIWVLPECPKLLAPVLGKLRLVDLDKLPEGCDIAWTMFILQAAPCLKELCITVWDHWCSMVTDKERRKAEGYCDKVNVEWKPSVSGFRHMNLAKLTIYGFQPDDNFMQYIRCVLEAAVNLEEISLHDKKACKRCKDLDSKNKDSPIRYPQNDMERKHIVEELGTAWPAVVHFRS